MHKGSLVLSAACLAIAAGSASAQVIRQVETDNTAYGTTAAEFLLLPATARGAALGGSFAALTTDVSSIYFNPAGLSQMSRPSIIASSMTYVADTKYNYVAFGMPNSGGSRAFGLSFASFGFSDAPVYTVEDPQGTSGEVYSVNQSVMGLTYSQQFSDRFSAGLTGKFINDRLGDVVGQAFAVDFGASFHANVGGRPVRAAFVIQNLGTTLSHDGQALAVTVRRAAPLDQQEVAQEGAAASLQSKDWGLPVTFRVALSYDLFATTASRLSLLGEFTQPTNSDPGFNLAGEYNLGLGRSGFSIAGRGGFTYAPDNNLDPAASSSANYAGFNSTLTKDGSDGLSAGGGLHYQGRTFGIGFDYAYRNLGFLGSVNMLSVAFNW